MNLQDIKSRLFSGNTIKYIGLSGGIAILASVFLFTDVSSKLSSSMAASKEAPAELGAFKITIPTMKYGFAIDTFQVTEKNIKNGQALSDLLSPYGMSYAEVDRLAANAKGIFDIRQLRAGNSYTVLGKKGDPRADYFIYEPNVYEYVKFHLKGNLEVEKIKREVTTATETAGGVLESSLWQSMTDSGHSLELTDKMEDALQWSVDFHHLQKGDEYKLVYDQHFVEGKPVDVSKVKAAYYKTGDKEFYAVYYDNGEYKGYYNLKGQPMKSSFLKAPLKYSRISSYYNLSRLHPVLKYRRPHFGTDYAAPYGTPILAVGDGVIAQASFTSGNGNFVKIRHDGTYETQYLHMKGFAKGIRPGARVSQGQVIGYVGSTGLATGPHVCFRFWKNGQQVNHLKLNFPPAKPLPESEMAKFNELKDGYLELLKAVQTKKTGTGKNP